MNRLTLTDFRSYKALRFTPDGPVNVLAGPNGTGKTNLLEAISLLVPGRGLRGAKFSELARRGAGASGSWAVAARFDQLEIGTGTAEGAPERRTFLLDGVKPRSQTEIGEKLAAVWLTPQMDRLFTDPASGRRKFLDRLVIALEPSHARELAAFESASAQRNRLLAENPDPVWLAGLEDSLARHATAATASRMALVAALNATLAGGAADPFPRVHLGLECGIAAMLAQAPAVAVEDALRAEYAANRAPEGGTHAGPHKADLRLRDAAGRGADEASTGQQKAMLIGVVLGHAALIARVRGTAPLLLLDEPLVHLDAGRREALFAALRGMRLSAWLTGTDAEPFFALGAPIFKIEAGQVAAF